MKSKSVLLTLLAIVGAGIVIFMAMTAYYAALIKSGKISALEQEFQSGNFTADPSHVKTNAPPVMDVRPYLRSTNPTRGSTKAPITIVAFIDFECPFSQAEYPIFKKITDHYAPIALVIFKNFPITVIHPNSNTAANAAACAGEQGKFWPYYDLLFQTKHLDRDAILSYAATLKLKPAQFTQCLDSAKHQAAIDKDVQDGVDLGVRGTPTYFVNGIKIEGAVDEATWDQALLEALKGIKK